ncbi:hypothetical protein BA898_06215 [Spiribacter roseus]|nr:hypothetical protein BA898_06215 [Spiribacter roseus]
MAGQSIKRFEYPTLGKVHAVFGDFLALEDREGNRWVAATHKLGRARDITQLVAGEAVEVGALGIELVAQSVAPIRVPPKGRALVVEVSGE